jgi:hypothetical protein
MDSLLRRTTLTRAGTAETGDCLDAETLAAWCDGTLAPSRLAAAEAHASSCDRCLALVAAMERTAPPTQAPTRVWFQGSMFRWLVPLTAAVTVVAIWIAVPRDDRSVVRESVDAPATTGEPSVTAPPTAPPAVPPLPAASPAPTRPMSATTDEPRAGELSSARRVQQADRESDPQVQLQEQQPRRENTADDRQAAVGGLAESITIAGERPPSDAATPQARGGGAGGGRFAAAAPAAMMRLESAIAPFEIVSPNPSIRWRAGPAGRIERSTDRGTSWTPISTSVTTDLTAGVSPSQTVCWLVGRAGTVLLSTDGVQFRPLKFPEPINLSAVRAVDAENATVTAVDGRTFTTSDGGLTWAVK